MSPFPDSDPPFFGPELTHAGLASIARNVYPSDCPGTLAHRADIATSTADPSEPTTTLWACYRCMSIVVVRSGAIRNVYPLTESRTPLRAFPS